MNENTGSDLPNSKALLEFFEARARRPMSPAAVAQGLGAGERAIEEVSRRLEKLAEEGRLVATRHGRYGLPGRMNLAVGIITLHPDGFGFVNREDDPDVFVPARKLGDAMHEDRVIARLEGKGRGGKPEGRVIRILERGRQRLVGTFEPRGKGGWVVPRDPRMRWDVNIAEADRGGAEAGQVVHVEITRYPKETRGPEGRVLEILGETGDADVDVEVVIRAYGLPHTFPDEVLAQAAQIPDRVEPDQLRGRRDFRSQPTVTIDGETAQDFDDAVHVERLDNGHFQLTVHIADVAAYVAPGSPIDREARERGTSVYFPRRVVPMLPEVLSNQICSLRPDVDRLVQSVVMEITPSGRTVASSFHDGVIRSSARLTYTEVAAALDGDAEAVGRHRERLAHFEAMRDLCTILRESRGRRGSLDFDLPEPQLVIDLTGAVEAIIRSERNIAHRIVEEFMIRANEVVACHLADAERPCLYRIHEDPEPDRMENFRAFVAGIGYTLGGGDSPRPRHFQRLVEKLEGRPEQSVVSLLLLSTLSQARYSIENFGHFGLASEFYCHFTSPIRRYPDLIVHRLLRQLQHRKPAAPSLDELAEIATQSSVRERHAEEAEREYVGWKKTQFMEDKVGETCAGYIVGVQPFGLFVELEAYLVSGLVHVSSLGDDYYTFEGERQRLVGENKGRAFALGDSLQVKVERVDPERRRIDLTLVGDETQRP